MKKRPLILLALAGPLAAACGGEAQKAEPTAAPAPPARPTALPMLNKIILYGDMALFDSGSNPDNCILKSRYRRGEGVGFRMTAINPLSGEIDETADLTVKLANGENIPMRWRGTGDNPRKWMWTAKWVVPDTVPLGVMKYTVEAKDKEGRTGVFAPFDVLSSMLTIVS